MRLTQDHIAKILHITHRLLGEDVSVWVYGSRLDDGRRGGDLDLLIQSSRHITIWQRTDLKMALEPELQMPVDILTYQHGSEPTTFKSLALAQAVRLEQAA